jgi:hypothetical protein
MSTAYGIKSKLIGAEDILSISTGNLQVISSGNQSNGAFFIQFYPTGGGCGTPTQLALAINLKETYPKWTKLSYKLKMDGIASCWAFNQGGIQFGIDTTNNIAAFNTGLGDKYFKSKNCWELYPFTISGAVVATACNNNFNNPFHGTYKSGDFREFYTFRRRSSLDLPAGPGMYLSCNSTGNYITISNIFVQ